MGWDGAGGYNRERNWSADASAGIKILASAMDQEFNDVVSAITLAVARDGQNTPTANLPMGGFVHTGVGAASSATNYIRGVDIVQNIPIYMEDSESSADRISVSATWFTTVSAGQAPAGGTKIMVRANSEKNSAVALYLNAGFGTAHSANVVLQNGSAIYSGAIVSGGIYDLVFQSADTVWQLGNPSFLSAPTDGRFAATTDIPGFIEIATTAEGLTGTDTSRAVTPAVMAAKFSADAATTASAGLIELATTAEVTAGTDNSRAVTPSTLRVPLSALDNALPYLINVAHEGVSGSAISRISQNTKASGWSAELVAAGTYRVIHPNLSAASAGAVNIQMMMFGGAGGRDVIPTLTSVGISTFTYILINTSANTHTDVSTNAYIQVYRVT